MSTTAYGIALGLFGSICINLGNNLQSLGMTQLEIADNDAAAARDAVSPEENFDERAEIDACESKIWIAGTVIFVTGSLLTFAAFAFAPQSILASIEGVQVLFFSMNNT